MYSSPPVPNATGLEDITPSVPIDFAVADGGCMKSTGLKGNFKGQSPDGNSVTLKDVEVVPKLSQPLFSVLSFMKDNKDVWFNCKDMSVNLGHLDPAAKNTTITKGHLEKGLFHFKFHSKPPTCQSLLASGIPSKPNWELWHARLMHYGFPIIKRTLESEAVRGLHITGSLPTNFHCRGCIEGKMHRRPHPSSSLSEENLFQSKLSCVSVDLLHLPLKSIGGASYFLGISVNSANGFKIGYPLKLKGETIVC
jgi:hypothetical protein